jgi:hypothetical protein
LTYFPALPGRESGDPPLNNRLPVRTLYAGIVFRWLDGCMAGWFLGRYY